MACVPSFHSEQRRMLIFRRSLTTSFTSKGSTRSQQAGEELDSYYMIVEKLSTQNTDNSNIMVVDL